MIREPSVADAERIAQAHTTAAEEAYGHYFPHSWRLELNALPKRIEQWTAQLQAYADGTDAAETILIAERGEQVVGFGILGQARDADAPASRELHRLYVLSQCYGTGIARQLLDVLVPAGTATYLWVMEANHRAVSFYRKQGYAADGVSEPVPHCGGYPKMRMSRLG